MIKSNLCIGKRYNKLMELDFCQNKDKCIFHNNYLLEKDKVDPQDIEIVKFENEKDFQDCDIHTLNIDSVMQHAIERASKVLLTAQYITGMNNYIEANVDLEGEMYSLKFESHKHIDHKKADPDNKALTIPDIRNKLGSIVHLISMIEDNRPDQVQNTLPTAKKAVNYLADREVYPKDEWEKPEAKKAALEDTKMKKSTKEPDLDS